MLLGELLNLIDLEIEKVQLSSNRNTSKIIYAHIIPKEFYNLPIRHISCLYETRDYEIVGKYLHIFLGTSKSVAMTKTIKAYEDKLYGRFREIE